MDWSELVLLIVGALLASGGGYLSQRRAEQSASAREAREREHERETWARSLRHEAHVAFLAVFDRRYAVVRDAMAFPDPGSEPDHDYLSPVWDAYQAVRLVCTEATAKAGERAFEALMAHTFHNGPWGKVDYERDRYLAAVRQEFGLPPVPIMGHD